MQSFKLVTNFTPTGDQPQAIGQLVDWVRQGHSYQTLLGVTGSGKTFTLASVIDQLDLPTLIISHNKTLAAQLYQEFRDFFPENAVSYFVSYYDYYQPESYLPATDTYIEKETDINDEIDKLRLSATTNLLSRPDTIIVASVSCIYNLGSPIEYAKNLLELIPGQQLPRSSLFARLIDMQYQRLDTHLHRGTFRVLGDALQIWPAHLDHALKLQLLDDTIESITPVHPVDLTPVTSDTDRLPGPPRYRIYPAKHYQSTATDQEAALTAIRADLAQRLKDFKSKGKVVESYRLAQKVKHDLEMIRQLGYVNGIENYSRYFDGRQPGDPPFTLLDYFHHNVSQFNKPNFLTIIDESHITLPQIRGMYRGDLSRKQTLIDYGFRLPSALDNRPLNFSEFSQRVPQIICSSATPQDFELQQSRSRIAQQLIRPTGLLDPAVYIRPTQGQITDLVKEIMARVALDQRVLVTTLTKRTAEALTDYLNQPHKITKALKIKSDKPPRLPRVQYLHADVHTLDRSDILDSLRAGEYDVIVGINLLREGLDLPEVSLVAILEADQQGFLRSRSSLIQTMGRAARHRDGRVILYADRTSPAMSAAIKEVKRRRRIQHNYNRTHSITPTSISKPIRDKLLDRQADSSTPKLLDTVQQYIDAGLDQAALDALTPKDKLLLVKKLTLKMNQAAKAWDFETAATLRDTIAYVESH